MKVSIGEIVDEVVRMAAKQIKESQQRTLCVAHECLVGEDSVGGDPCYIGMGERSGPCAMQRVLVVPIGGGQ